MNATPVALFESHAPTVLRLRQSTAAERRAKLARLLATILARQDAILDAAHRDLGKHPTETNLTELLPLIGEVEACHCQAEALDEAAADRTDGRDARHLVASRFINRRVDASSSARGTIH